VHEDHERLLDRWLALGEYERTRVFCALFGRMGAKNTESTKVFFREVEYLVSKLEKEE